MKKAILILSLILYPLAAFCQDNTERKSFALSLNYPGIGLKLALSGKSELELRYQYIDDIHVGGIKFYRILGKPDARLKKFWGAEAGGIDYKSQETKGNGVYGGLHLGGEYMINQLFGFQMDFGSYYISLTEDEYSLSEQGLGISLNFGMNFYLF